MNMVNVKTASRKLVFGLGGVVCAVLAVSAYLWFKPSPKALPDAVAGAPAWKLSSATTTMPPAPHTTNVGDISVMAERLAARLKDQPNDAQGWAILARSYDVMGNLPDALVAYKKALALMPDDQALLTDYAKAVAKANQGGGTPAAGAASTGIVSRP
jgi:cytochrome c-type biogenesis protein CcmH